MTNVPGADDKNSPHAGKASVPEHDLRERLRSLGYLNAPVDRFVLGGALGHNSRRSTILLAAGASARIGILAGLLLGPAAAIGLNAQLPDLITNLTDAVVIAAYLSVMFGIAAAIAAFIVTVPAGLFAQSLHASSSFAKNAHRIAGAAGALIFVTCLAYLTLWWRVAVTASAPTLMFSVTAIAVAVTISLVLAHVVTVTALALVARDNSGGRDRAAMNPGVPLSSWRAAAPLAAIAFIGAAALLFAAAPTTPTGPASPPLTVIPTGERVLVLAIDGVDIAVLDRLRADKNSLPNFAQLLSGASASLSTDANRDPARVWTTIATGQTPERHGISALQGRQIRGVDGQLRPTSRFGALATGATDLLRLTRPTITSGNERRIPAFWEVAARAGLRTSVINWWATWPAPEGGEDTGVVLSDRALLRLEQGGALDGEIAPPALYTSLENTWPARRARAQARAKEASASQPEDIAAVIARAAAIDAEIIDLAAEGALADVDLQVVYLPGLDIAQHALLTESAATSSSAMTARVQAIEAYYRFLDALIGDVNRAPRSIVLVTQPGRVSGPGAGRIAIASSAAAKPPGSAQSVAPTSVAATALYLLGVPVALDLASDAAFALVADNFVKAHPAHSVVTYGPRRLTPRRLNGQPLDKEMIERMRSLGYLK